jgi:hypothetical protein
MIGVIHCVIARKAPLYDSTLVLVVIGFLCAPLLQTIRFPYYSSMKATFVLPSIAAMAPFVAHGLDVVLNNKVVVARYVIVVVVALGLVHWGVLISELMAGVPELSGPLWSLPALR